MKPLRLLALLGSICFLLAGLAPPAAAFCGFYVSQADASLYNQASQVVIARDRDRTILTLANDYQGNAQDFALVVPVPVEITEEQVNVGDPKVLTRLDEFSAPRLVEYFDEDPCNPYIYNSAPGRGAADTSAPIPEAAERDREQSLGVTIEASFSVGEYDILILSAKESSGLETWLRENDYNIPRGASRVLQPYIRQEFKFFVAKVNLEEFDRSAFQSLRPLQIAYESPRFMLPIRLGMLNAKGDQDLIVYILTPSGRVEVSNYRTVPIASNVNVPEFVEEEFGAFYKAMFQKSYETEKKEVAFLEYAWDMSWCDPCAANPLTPEELRQAGVFWLGNNNGGDRRLPPTPGPQNVYITRLHVRYARNKFPEDLGFQTTGNRENYQGRYVIQRPYRGEMDCDAATDYREYVRDRQEQELDTVVKLTGWEKSDLRSKVDWLDEPQQKPDPEPWWRDIWNR
ncbi:MAG: DUF2330 domain-containing protein [Spirulina sp. SIO3F2]|nr:DUF2330 domain-containing protein [Spirulina sp. SIO3F2]